MTQREIDRAAFEVRANPIEPDTIVCPPVVYDLPDSPIASVMAALRGGESRGRATVVAAIVLFVCIVIPFILGGK